MTDEPLSFSNALQFLIGEYLSSVEFVMDYVQLRFSGPCLTVYAIVQRVTKDGLTKTWGEPGYRDALCSIITHTLKQAHVETGQQLSLIFDDGSVWSVSLRDEDYRGPEAIYYNDQQRGLCYVI
jgi:hypothetical protein